MCPHSELAQRQCGEQLLGGLESAGMTGVGLVLRPDLYLRMLFPLSKVNSIVWASPNETRVRLVVMATRNSLGDDRTHGVAGFLPEGDGVRSRLPFLPLRLEERPRFASALAGVAVLACDRLHLPLCLQLPLAKNLHGDLLWVRFDESRFGDWDLLRPFLSFPFLPDGLGLLLLLELPRLEDF